MLCDLGDAILGIDGCIYWPPFDAGHTQPSFESIKKSLVGDDFGVNESK